MTDRSVERTRRARLRSSVGGLLLGAAAAAALAGAAALVGAWWACLLLLLVALVAGVLYVWLWRGLPQISGVVKAPGLRTPVTVRRDQDGVTHIAAQQAHDAWFALGYVHAQERLWQMELQRRIGQGRLSEVFGPRSLGADRMVRTIGLGRAALQSWEHLPGSARAVVEAYTAGINHFIATHRRSRLSPEWMITRCSPQPWTPADVLVGLKLMALNLGFGFETKLLRHDLTQALGAELAEQVMGGYPHAAPIPGVSTPGAPGAPISSFSAALQSAGVQDFGASAVGSNAWAVAGGRSVTGKPLLANDPHLGGSQPSLWYMAHLMAPELDVIGATIPGLPGVVIGRNRQIAWGLTNLNPDVQDLFWESLDDSGTQAEFQGRLEPITQVEEIIKVRGKPDVRWKVRITRHGPLLSDALNASSAARRSPSKPPQREPLALSWTALASEDTTLAGFLAINQAHDWDSFRQGLRLCVAPAVYFVYADTAGHIGANAAGHVPVRASGDGSLPAQGWSGAQEWTGTIPFDELPFRYDPPEQIVVAANNSPVDPTYPHLLARSWQPPFRAQRIADRLLATDRHDIASFAVLQADTVSLYALELLPALLPLVAPRGEAERRAHALLVSWDGNASADSPATALFAAWLSKLPRALLAPQVDQRRIELYERAFLYVSRFLLDTVRERRQPWFDKLTQPPAPDQRPLVEQTFSAAAALLTKRLGPEISGWRWGALHRQSFPHMPFQAVPVLGKLFSRSLSAGGDWSTVNFGAFSFDGTFRQGIVAGYRQIIDLSEQASDRFIVSGGQSGHVGAERYDDYFADWQAVRLRPLRLSLDAPGSGSGALLRLEP